MSPRRTFHVAASLAALGALGLALGGCSHLRSWTGHRDADAPATPLTTAAAGSTDSAAPAEAETVTSNLPDVDSGVAPQAETTTVIPDAGALLSPTAPQSYVVQRGDTLWGLAARFLKDPWSWPEIWYLNPEVSNPHHIYPGDTLRLAKGSDGKPVLQLVRTAGGSGATRLEPLLRSTPIEGPIANIPYSAIAGFLSRPAVLTKSQVEAAPYVLALRDRHMIAGAGNEVYVSRLQAAEGERFTVLHVGQRLKDPDGGGSLGYLAEYAGTAQVQRAGDPAKMAIIDSGREILTGDVLVPETAGSIGDFVPHAPGNAVKGRVLAVVNGVLLAGQFQIVALNRGSRDGLEPGNVLRVREAPSSVRDHCARIAGDGTCTRFRDTRLPSEAIGTLLVFRVFDRVSYALVASETAPLGVGDRVVSP